MWSTLASLDLKPDGMSYVMCRERVHMPLKNMHET